MHQQTSDRVHGHPEAFILPRLHAHLAGLISEQPLVDPSKRSEASGCGKLWHMACKYDAVK